MKVLFVINPCSGRGKIKNELMNILKIFCSAGYEVTTHITLYRGNATEIAETAKEKGYELIVCCGGDGTLNEVLTGLLKSKKYIPVGYIPAGTTNDFARTHGLQVDMEMAAKEIIDSKHATKIDVGKFMDDRYFSYIASFGLFTSVSYKTQQNVKNALGHMAYVFEGIASLSNIESYEVSVTADDRKFEGEYIYGGISNSTSVAGIFKYDTDLVDISDGLFEVLMIKKPKNPNDFMKIVSGVTTGDFSDETIFDFCKAAKITLEMQENVIWTLDGEAAEGNAVTVIENIPGKIKFVK